MQKKTKIIIISTILLLITISIIILLTKNINNQIPQPLTEQAKAQYETIIGDQTYDITNAVLEPENITPTISAGMIPIKWNGTNLEITTRKDTNWYDYANGKPAYIMLNDGYYKSEIEQGITNDQLMENAVGNDALVVPNVPGNNPTIYMWIPRFAYNAQGEILYIKQGYSIAGTYTIPEIFTYQTEKRDFSLAGIWIECTPLANTSEVNTKISNMQGPNNKYGFIANTKGINASNEPSYKTTIETYNQYIANIVNGTTGASFPTDSTTDTNTVGAPLAGIPEGHDTAAPITITDISNTNRTILKITNSNQPEPIKGTAYYDETEEKIKIEITYRTNAIAKILDINGKELSANSLTANTGEELIGNGIYRFIAIDTKGQQKLIKTTVTGLDVYNISNEEELKLFRDAVNNNKTTAKTIANQVADVYMNEGKYTIDEETGDIIFSEDADKWTGITTTYCGKYYGNNHTISGIYGNKGLFQNCDGAYIKDLGIINSYIIAYSSTGAIVGYVQNNTILENCYNEATIETKGNSVGGIVGETYNSSSAVQLTVNNCYNKGKIIVNSSYYNIGGIVGNAYNANISNCYNTGEITYKLNPSDRESNNGGIVGRMQYGYIRNSYNVANITGSDSVGGIAGQISSSWSKSIINNCYNIGNITGYNYVGGITGQGELNKCYNIGGITGNNDVGGMLGSLHANEGRQLTDLYNCGKVTGNNRIGGIFGTGFISRSGQLKNCYNIGSVSGNEYVAGIGGNNTRIVIHNVYNNGEISGKYYIGGIVAANSGDNYGTGTVASSYNLSRIIANDYVGGISGYNQYSARTNASYNIGNVVGDSYAGGIVGYNVGSISGNYYKTGTAAYGNGYTRNNSGAEPLDEMPTVMSIINGENGFKEDDTEKLINNGNPILSWQTDNDKLNLINSDNVFIEDTAGINNGYPILAWQVEKAE